MSIFIEDKVKLKNQGSKFKPKPYAISGFHAVGD